jgi:hypothetical protein
MKELLRSFGLYLILCVVWTFAHGLFLKFLPDFRTAKIVTELSLFGLILFSLFLRAPQHDLIRFTAIYGLLLFTSVALSNYFTYLMLNHSKYSESLGVATTMQLILCLMFTYFVSLVGQSMREKKRRKMLANEV